MSDIYPRETNQRVYLQLHEASEEITRLKMALREIYDVPWTSSGRGKISTQTNFAIALAAKDRIARVALKMDEPEDQP